MKQRWKKKITGLTLLFLFSSALPAKPMSAAEAITVSTREYSLTVADLPEGVDSRAYAKLHDTSTDASQYSLSLFDGYTAMIAMEDALESAGETLSQIDYQAMEITLYQMDEEGDYYPVEDPGGITLICPVPDSFSDHADDLQITAIGNSGSLMRIPSDIVTVSGVTCVRFDISVASTYAFLYKQGSRLSTGTVPTPTPVQISAGVTTAPTSTPARATATPTPRTTASTQNTTTTQPAKDKTPQTGDDFNRNGYLLLFGISAASLCGIAFYNFKQK